MDSSNLVIRRIGRGSTGRDRDDRDRGDRDRREGAGLWHRLLGVLAIGTIVLVLVPVVVVLDSYRIVPDLLPLARKTPDRTAVMAQRLAERRTPRPLRYHRVGLGAISPHLVHAVIVHEDATFFEHHGFDGFEIRAALRRSLAERQLTRGASTITTQLARNLYLGTERSLWRKLREIPLTMRLERALEKRRILELYLNVVEWGPGVFGAEAASRHHFGISARDLTPREAALLAAALPSPRRSTPARPSSYLRRRSAIILTRMHARGWLSPLEVDVARHELGFPSSLTVIPAEGDLELEPWVEPEPAATEDEREDESAPGWESPAPEARALDEAAPPDSLPRGEAPPGEATPSPDSTEDATSATTP